MKYIIIFIFISLSGIAQTEEELQAEAVNLYQQDKKAQAVAKFIELYEKYPESENAALTLYNIPVSYMEIDSTSQAIKWFQKLLSTDFKDNEEYYNFPDTHTNLKHKSATSLGNIYYNISDSKTAVEYYTKALYEYPYISSSGTSVKKNNIKLKKWIADCYVNLGQRDDVIKILLPEAITSGPWMTNPIEEFLINFIKENDDPKEFTKELDIALKSIKEKEDYYTIGIRGSIIKIEPYEFDAISASEFVKEVKQSNFYKTLQL